MCLVFCMAAGEVEAASLVQLSLTPDIALHDRATRINGVSLNIWGENPQTAFTLGLVNGSNGSSGGFTLGAFNYADNYTGFQAAVLNYTEGTLLGWQVGGFNYTVGSMQGIHLGVINYAGHLKGVQLGGINYAASASTGIQIGVVNIIPTNAWFTQFPDQIAPGMVIFNWRF